MNFDSYNIDETKLPYADRASIRYDIEAEVLRGELVIPADQILDTARWIKGELKRRLNVNRDARNEAYREAHERFIRDLNEELIPVSWAPELVKALHDFVNDYGRSTREEYYAAAEAAVDLMIKTMRHA